MRHLLSRKLMRQAKAILCVALIVNINLVMVGCGQQGIALSGGLIRVALDVEHPLTAALRGSDYAGATAVEVDPATGAFRMIFPDDVRHMSGQFEVENGQVRVTEFTLGVEGRTNTFSLDTLKQITRISNSQGQAWERPAEWAPAAPTTDNTVEAFMAANAQLIELASQVDATSQDQSTDDQGSTGVDPVKVSPSGFPFFPVLAMVLFFPAAVLGPIVFAIGIIVAVVLILQII